MLPSFEQHRFSYPRTNKMERIRRQKAYGKQNTLDCSSLYEAVPNSPRIPPKLQKRRETKSAWAPLKASKHAQNTVNPIRKICDAMAVPPNPAKDPIRLNLGDPTVIGNLLPSDASIQAIQESLVSHKNDGYGPSVGTLEAREAVAQHFATPEMPISADDVILTSGASHALDLALTAIADPGENILVPAPGFPLYTTLCRPNGIDTRQYQLKMNDTGLIDLADLEAQIDANTRAIIVNNPSNPTGVVFPKEHLEDILRVAYRHKLVIIADEIYGDLTYDGAVFHPMASLSPRVPIISVDGIAKRYLVPGWRLGWAIVHDRYGVLAEVKKGMIALSQKIVGPCALIQGALPKILRDTPKEYFDNIKDVISRNTAIVYDVLSRVPGLKPLRPQGAMYMMVGFERDIYGEETQFVQGLITEESVYCLPGSAFNLPNWFRLVLTYPEDVTRTACERVSEYCNRRLAPVKYLAPESQRSVMDDGSEGNMSTLESDE
ncbi:Tyrosine aminotransferase [Aphelenchoides besseyi]|nr:Tyrosine aminotransferase [Aphelenchoides besseyi]KAI6201763.1 Tyrosine aminotransferase [Aphelenchoides besseyi]